jgi:HEPN domain-containing protein
MKQPGDLARRYLALADRDIKTFRLLADVTDSDDEAVGFHAQQAVEKCLKAVLAGHRVEFRKTHDLRELLERLTQSRLPQPPDVEGIMNLSPYAVMLRYDLIEVAELNRGQARSIVDAVRRWAGEQITESTA